jgi:SHS2 domain-containing protein
MVCGVARPHGRDRGHRTRAHTADVIVEAWGPTREACLEEAVLGLVGAFADVRGLAPSGRVGLTLPPADDEETLVALLDELVYVLDARDAVPVAVSLDERFDGGVSGWFATVPAASVTITGATPKGVSRSELIFAEEHGRWRCRVEIDV